jgi:CRP-like cAMP-binding protein
MGKRARKQRRSQAAGPASFAELGLDLELAAPDGAEVRTHADADGRALELRTALSPGTRAEYAALLRGERSSAATAREDVWQRAVEFLFERLAVAWTVAGVRTEGQSELLARLRAATGAERASVRAALRAHLAEHFPELGAP